MAKWHFIYGLFSTKKRKCLYVGMSNNPINRFNSHILTRTTKGRRFEFTILKRVKARYAQREEARAIKHYQSRGEATLNRVPCKSSLSRTISNSEAAKFVQSVKHATRTIVTQSDKNTIFSVARSLRQLEIRDVRFKAIPHRKGFKIIAIVMN